MKYLLLILLTQLALASMYVMVVTNPNTFALENYQVKVSLPPQLQGNYLLLLYSNTQVPYCFEYLDSCVTDPASPIIWIRVPYIPPRGDARIYVTLGSTAYNMSQVFDRERILIAQNCCYGANCVNSYLAEKGDIVDGKEIYYINDVVLAYEGDYDDVLEYAYVYINGNLVGTLDGYLNVPTCFQGPLLTTTYTVNDVSVEMYVRGNDYVDDHYEVVYVNAYLKKLAPAEPTVTFTVPNNYVFVSLSPETATVTWRGNAAVLTSYNATTGLLLTLTNATCMPYGFDLYASNPYGVYTYTYGTLSYALLSGSISVNAIPVYVALTTFDGTVDGLGLMLKGYCKGELDTIFLYTTSTYVTTSFVYTYTTTSTVVITNIIITTTTDSFGNTIYTTSEVTTTYYKLVTYYTTITTPTTLTLTKEKVIARSQINGFIERRAYHQLTLPTTIIDTELLLTPLTVVVEGAVNEGTQVPLYLLPLMIALLISKFILSRSTT